jgi:DNA invertase Pin-like site-specific DNA recombinase
LHQRRRQVDQARPTWRFGDLRQLPAHDEEDLDAGQEIDLTTQAGFLTSGVIGVIAGLERQMIMARTSAGREISRQRGGNPCGSIVLPRGVSYSKSAGWAYVEPHASQVRRAYDLLFERRSWHDIADRIGGGFTFNGIRNSLANPIWKGVRRYTEGRE